MQYRINLSSHCPASQRRWEVIGLDKNGDYLGRICAFNTEEQAIDYAKVQEGIEVKFERKKEPKTDFKVLINGEHRATFRKRFSRAGYHLEGADGSDIPHRRHLPSSVTQADFEVVVRTTIAAGDMPTLAQIERSHLIHQAQVENRAWDQAKTARRTQVRREVLQVALNRYMYDAGAGKITVDMEHVDMAAHLLRWEQGR